MTNHTKSHSPLCFVTSGHRPLRQAHWLSASVPLLVDIPLSYEINNREYQYFTVRSKHLEETVLF